MANAANRPRSCDDPPPAYSSLDHPLSPLCSRPYPLATIATRDSSSPNQIGYCSTCNSRIGYDPGNSRQEESSVPQRPYIAPTDYPAQNAVPPLPSRSNDVVSMPQSQCPAPLPLPALTQGSYGSCNQQPFTVTSSDNNSSSSVSATSAPNDSIFGRFHPTNPFIADLIGSNTVQTQQDSRSSPPRDPNPSSTFVHKYVKYFFFLYYIASRHT